MNYTPPLQESLLGATSLQVMRTRLTVYYPTGTLFYDGSELEGGQFTIDQNKLIFRTIADGVVHICSVPWHVESWVETITMTPVGVAPGEKLGPS